MTRVYRRFGWTLLEIGSLIDKRTKYFTDLLDGIGGVWYYSSDHNGMDILDVGCGRHKRPNSIGIDRNPASDADVVHDLGVFPYPFGENAFDLVHCDSILEHLDDFFGVMEELHRITRPGGRVLVKVPYYTSFDAYTDPTHRHFFTSRSFEYFREDYCYHYYTTARFAVVQMHLSFLKLRQLGGLSPHQLVGIEFLANRFLKIYEAFFAYWFPAHILTCELEVLK